MKPNPPCKCGSAQKRTRNEAMRLWKHLNDRPSVTTRSAFGLPECPEPPLDEDGEIDTEKPCIDNPEQKEVDVWAPAYMQWNRVEGLAIIYGNELSTLTDLLDDLHNCRGIIA